MEAKGSHGTQKAEWAFRIKATYGAYHLHHWKAIRIDLTARTSSMKFRALHKCNKSEYLKGKAELIVVFRNEPNSTIVVKCSI